MISEAHPNIALNGIDISAYGLVPLEGTIATILKPPPLKKLVTNENAYMHGIMALTQPSGRRIDKQDMSLSFFLYAPSMRDLYRQVTKIESLLINGEKDGSGLYTGINTLTLYQYDKELGSYIRDADMGEQMTPINRVAQYVGPSYLPLCLRLIYNGTKKLQPWFPTGKAVITFNFIEPNPSNRTLGYRNTENTPSAENAS